MAAVAVNLVGIFVFCCLGQVYSQLSSGCQLPVDVQPNFNVEKYLGRWNELMWVAPEDEKDYDATDYFWVLGNVTHHDVIPIASSGRDVGSGTCFGGPLKLKTTSSPGVLLLDTGNGRPDTLVYVLQTDYTTYANVYGCYDYSADRTMCHKGRAWLWARGTTLSENLKHLVLKQWSTLCLDLRTLLKYTDFPGNECPV